MISRSRGVSRTGLIAAVALVAAASAFVMPALDPRLRGGSIVWQLGALAVAIVCGWWVLRSSGADAKLPKRAIIRVVAYAALIAALVWVGGVVFLWIIWPR